MFTPTMPLKVVPIPVTLAMTATDAITNDVNPTSKTKRTKKAKTRAATFPSSGKPLFVFVVLGKPLVSVTAPIKAIADTLTAGKVTLR